MEMKGPLLPQQKRVPMVRDGDQERTGSETLATRDHEVIRRWAAKRTAEPATGEGVVDINDGGAGIRFNFPGVSRFRPMSWGDWLEHFDHHRLTFIYEEARDGGISHRFRLVKAEDWDGQL
jgi:hypothetical protein